MKIYYQIKKNSPEHFSNRDPASSKIEQCLKHQDYFYLPNTPKGDLVIFHRLATSKASDYVFDEAIKTFFMTIGLCTTIETIQLNFKSGYVSQTHVYNTTVHAMAQFFFST